MKDKLQKTLTGMAAAVKDSVSDLTDSAKEKSMALIEDWLQVFPELEALGLEITSFGISLAISPALEVELHGPTEAFTTEELDQHIATYADQKYVLLVLKTIRRTQNLYLRFRETPQEELFVKIKVKVPPEVRVYFGRPMIV
ncbi:MAG: hypothetical protein R3301_19560 [Saprospiraceae bacterium]|nr:hypothetical protein [Saprospiraceae bacterium]